MAGEPKIINLPGGQSLEKMDGDASYIVRGHKLGGQYGSEWQWAAVAVINNQRVEIKGLCVAEGGKFSVDDHASLAEFFRSEGVTEGWYERIRNGKVTKHYLK